MRAFIIPSALVLAAGLVVGCGNDSTPTSATTPESMPRLAARPLPVTIDISGGATFTVPVGSDGTGGEADLGCSDGTVAEGIVREFVVQLGFTCTTPTSNGTFTIQLVFGGNWNVLAGTEAYANLKGSGSFSDSELEGFIDFHGRP